tara:strand:- start:2335 stop:3135 length:801 start_codon:yes stop_codon:yes gene_type:complete
MERYINLPTKMYAGSTATNAVAVDSGTTDTTATAGKLEQAGQNFVTTVAVGDYAVITTGIAGYPVRTWSKVTAVDSNTVLSITGAGNEAGVAGGLSAIGTVYAIIAAADISTCVLSGATFNTDVQGGDVVCNETTNLNYTVASVTDATTIVLAGDNFGILVGDDFFILSDRGSQGSRKVRLDNATEIRGNASDGQVTVHYKKGAAANDKLAIDMGDTVTDDAYFIKFKEVAQNVMKSQWTVNSGQMPLVLSSGTQGIQWAGAFTFS